MRARWLPLAGITLGLLLATAHGGRLRRLPLREATIADLHAAFKARTLTCRALVQMYLDRIEAYDRKGPR
jgi:hypothetical protein